MKTPPVGASGRSMPRIDSSTVAAGAEPGTDAGAAAGAADTNAKRSEKMVRHTTTPWWMRMPSPPEGLASAISAPRVKPDVALVIERGVRIAIDTSSQCSYFPARIRTEARGRVPLAPRRGFGAGGPYGRRRHPLIRQRREITHHETQESGHSSGHCRRHRRHDGGGGGDQARPFGGAWSGDRSRSERQGLGRRVGRQARGEAPEGERHLLPRGSGDAEHRRRLL